MSLKKESIFYDILNVSSPWDVALISYSKNDYTLNIKLDYNHHRINCPVCGHQAPVIGKETRTWRYHPLFEYDTSITAYIPVIGQHNETCRVDEDPVVLVNTIFLDLLLKQQKRFDRPMLFHRFFSAKKSGMHKEAQVPSFTTDLHASSNA